VKRCRAASSGAPAMRVSASWSRVSVRVIRCAISSGCPARSQVLAPYVEAGVNFTYGKIKTWQATDPTNPSAELGAYDKGASTTDSDFGGFLNVRPVDRFVAGVGINYNQQVDEKGGTFTHRQAFLALQYQAAKSLFFKLVVADAKAHLAPGGEAAWDNTMRSARLRALFLF
jgi:hypothetical protein